MWNGRIMNSAKKEPMGNGYDHFVCPKCGHDNPADCADKLNCESCGITLKMF